MFTYLPRTFAHFVLLLLAAPLASSAQSPSCYDPMEVPGTCLPWGFVDLQQELGSYVAVDLSKDGSTIAAVLSGAFGVARWKLDSGLDIYSPPPSLTDPFLNIQAPVLSEDGSFIAGRGVVSSVNRVFRWDVINGTTLILPTGPAPYTNQADGTVRPRTDAAISADGDTIVGIGTALNASGGELTSFWPFVWTSSGGTDANSAQDFSDTFLPFTLDGSGARVAGREIDTLAGIERAVHWAPGTGTPIAPFNQSRATAISYDGQVIAGQRSDGGVSRSFRWTQSTGAVDIPERFQARTVSDDGDLVSGYDLNTALPSVWTDHSGYRLLDEHLNDFGVGVPSPTGSSSPLAVASGDGAIFAVLAERWVANVRPLKHLALGDSYSSGEGANKFFENYRSGTADDDVNECHRSNAAHPAIIGPPTSKSSYRAIDEIQAISTAETGFSWSFLACSGATTENVLPSSMGGKGQWQSPDNVPQLDRPEVDGDTDLVTITIGGNDALFKYVLETCVKNIVTQNCFELNVPGTSLTYEQALRQHIRGYVKGRLVLTFSEIKSATMNNAAVVALGYPLLISADQSFETCPQASGIIAVERAIMNSLGMQLNETIAEAAEQAGVHFVPTVAQEFDGHNVCDSDPWIRGIQAFQPLVHYFHPTAEGQEAYARALRSYFLSKLHSGYPGGFFESGMPRNPIPVP